MEERGFGGWSATCRMLAICVVIGAIAGVLGGALDVFRAMVEGLSFGVPLSDIASTSPLRRVLALMGGACIVGVSWCGLRRGRSPLPSVSRAVAGERMPPVRTVLNSALQIVAVGSGLSVGREGAPRELGALAGQVFASLLKLKDEDRVLIMASAAGAGLAGVYHAPLAGAFFSIELLLKTYSPRAVVCALMCSVAASWSASFLIGQERIYEMGAVPQSVDATLLVRCLLFGLLAAAAGEMMRRLCRWARGRQETGLALLWQIPVAALVTGIISIWMPQILGNGQPIASLAMKGGAGASCWGALAACAAVKLFVTVLTLRMGVAGGILTPSIAVGAALGAAFGAQVDPSCCALFSLMGAASFLGASQGAPLMAACLIGELTRCPLVMLPLLLASGLCAGVAGRVVAAVEGAFRGACESEG